MPGDRIARVRVVVVDHDGVIRHLHLGLTSPSTIKSELDALLATGFGYDVHTRDDNNLREFSALTRRSRGVRNCRIHGDDAAL